MSADIKRIINNEYLELLCPQPKYKESSCLGWQNITGNNTVKGQRLLAMRGGTGQVEQTGTVEQYRPFRTNTNTIHSTKSVIPIQFQYK